MCARRVQSSRVESGREGTGWDGAALQRNGAIDAVGVKGAGTGRSRPVPLSILRPHHITYSTGVAAHALTGGESRSSSSSSRNESGAERSGGEAGSGSG